MKTSHNVRLTSAELACLWTSYCNNSLARCVISYFLRHIDDTDILPLLEIAHRDARKMEARITEIFKNENVPIPHAFRDNDVNLDAPRLFADTFYLNYLKHMARVSLKANGIALSICTREDVLEFYQYALECTLLLNRHSTQILLSKGMYIRPPYISVPEKVEFLHKPSFIAGLFKENRTLLAIEISNLYGNIQTNALGKALVIGFSQVAKQPEVREFMVRAKAIASKHIEVFGSILSKDDIPVPMTWDTDVADSTISPFSDKLMLIHVLQVASVGISDYGDGIGTSMRADLIAGYSRLLAENLKLSQDGAELALRNAWLEQPPKSDDRRKLAGV